MNPSVVCAHHSIHMCSHKKICCLWSCSLFFCTTAPFHLAGRYTAFLIFLSPLKKCSCCFFFQRNQSPLHFPLALATILDKINGKPKPPLPPNQGGENGAFLPFARLHPWFGGEGGGRGWGFAVPFYFVQDCSSFSVIHVSVYRHSFVVLFTLKVRLAMRSLKRVGAWMQNVTPVYK